MRSGPVGGLQHLLPVVAQQQAYVPGPAGLDVDELRGNVFAAHQRIGKS